MLKAWRRKNATLVASVPHEPEYLVSLDQVVIFNHDTRDPRQDCYRGKCDDFHFHPFGVYLQQVNRTTLGKFQGLLEADTLLAAWAAMGRQGRPELKTSCAQGWPSQGASRRSSGSTTRAQS